MFNKRHAGILSFFIMILLSTCLVAEEYGGNFIQTLSSLGKLEEASTYITTITFDIDMPFSVYEFDYLTDLKPHSFITKQQIDMACHNLFAKKRFESITVDLIDEGPNKRLHFTLRSVWVFDKVVFDNVWFGRPSFVNYYNLQGGSVFDSSGHEESLKSVERYLIDKGFFNCSINDELVYRHKRKTITAYIKIKKKKRFLIHDAFVIFVDYEKRLSSVGEQFFADFDKGCFSKIRSKLKGEYYSLSFIQKKAKKIKRWLVNYGFVHSRIAMRKKLDRKKHNVTLTFSITLGVQTILTCKGNSIFSEKEICDQFVGPDLPSWLFSPDIITQQLLHEYYKKGYWDASITPISHQKSRCHLVIDEHKPVLIESVRCINVDTEQEEYLDQAIFIALIGKPCDQKILDEALTNVSTKYVNHGFWDFTITEKEFKKNEASGKYEIVIFFKKGKQCLYAGCEIKEHPQLLQDPSFRKYPVITKDLPPVPFDIRWLYDQKSFLKDYFHSKGYWYANIFPELMEMPGREKETISLFVSWAIEQGKKVCFGKTIIQGQTSIPFKKIKQQVKAKEGEAWDRKKIDTTRRKLKSYDVFKTVQIQSTELSENTGKKPVVVTLVDDDPIELRARIGWFLTSKNFLIKRQSTVKLGGSVILKNITNNADKLAIDGDWNKFEKKAMAHYQQPALFGFSPMGTVRLFTSKYIHPVEIAHSGSAYEATDHGFSFGLHDEYTDDINWNLFFGNEWCTINRVRGDIKFNQGLLNKTLPYFFIDPHLTFDRRDNKASAKDGYLTALSLKLMVPEKHGTAMAKLLTEHSQFVPLYGDLIFAGRIRLGHIFRGAFDKVLPNERFYLGGPNSVRGYQADAIPPLGVTEKIVDGKVQKLYNVQGGSTMLNLNAELRFPVVKKLGGVLFYDIGVLSQNGFLGLQSRWYPGTGFGLRYNTPIGAIRFDLGWKWKRGFEFDTKSYAWYLTLGESF